MEYAPTANPLFFIPTGIIVILDILSFPWYLHWLRTGEIQKSRRLLLLKPFSLAVCVYFLFTQFGAGFFAGTWYCLLAPIIATAMLLYYLAQIRREYKERESLTRADVVNYLFGTLLIISIAAPSFLLRPITTWCDNANSAKIPLISEAVQRYHYKNGKYPDEIKKLIPEYMLAIPDPSCGLLSGHPRKFELNNCEPPYVFVKTIDFVGHDLYRLEDGSIIHLGSFFDNGPYQCP
jgi:hypothetical protein